MKPRLKTVERNKKLKKGSQKSLPSKQWISRYQELQAVSQKERAVKWALRTFSVTLFCTFAIYLLQGFHPKGFALPQPLLSSLAYTTVGQVAGFVILTFKFVFR